MVEPPTLERAYRLRCYPTRRQRAVLGRLRRQITYKGTWAGRQVVRAADAAQRATVVAY